MCYFYNEYRDLSNITTKYFLKYNGCFLISKIYNKLELRRYKSNKKTCF